MMMIMETKCKLCCRWWIIICIVFTALNSSCWQQGDSKGSRCSHSWLFWISYLHFLLLLLWEKKKFPDSLQEELEEDWFLVLQGFLLADASAPALQCTDILFIIFLFLFFYFTYKSINHKSHPSSSSFFSTNPTTVGVTANSINQDFYN